MKKNDSPENWKLNGILMRMFALICAVALGLPGLLAEIFPLFLMAFAVGIGLWKLGGRWIERAFEMEAARLEEAPAGETAAEAEETLPGEPAEEVLVEEPAAEAEENPAEEPAAEAEESPAEEPAAEAEESPAEEPAAEAEESPAEEPAAEAEESPAEEPAAEAEDPAEEIVTEVLVSPVDLGEYRGSSGGFMNASIYRVSGVNAITKRKNKRTYEAVNEAHLRNTAEQDRFGNLQIEAILPQPAPTKTQLSIVRDLGLLLPEGVCRQDITALMGRLEDTGEAEVSAKEPVRLAAAPSAGFARYASRMGVVFSAFIGEAELLELVVEQLSLRDKLAFYAYCVWCAREKTPIADPADRPDWESLQGFAGEAAQKKAVVKSLESRDLSDYRNPNKGTAVYKALAEYWKQQEAAAENT